MRKRGAAVLSFVRCLSVTRPVTLYACNSVGGSRYGTHVIVRLDTAPLDLARVAHVLTDPSVTRGLCYASCHHLAKKELGRDWHGSWAYDNHSEYLKQARTILMRASGCSGEAILVPAAHMYDPCVKEPVVWLKQMLRAHGGMITED